MKIKFPKCVERAVYAVEKNILGHVFTYDISEYCGWAKTEYKELCIIPDGDTYQLLGISYSNLPWVILTQIKSLAKAKKEAKIYIEGHKSEYQKLNK
jgi:hypothetical protein